jgi:hypothetical protein
VTFACHHIMKCGRYEVSRPNSSSSCSYFLMFLNQSAWNSWLSKAKLEWQNARQVAGKEAKLPKSLVNAEYTNITAWKSEFKNQVNLLNYKFKLKLGIFYLLVASKFTWF